MSPRSPFPISEDGPAVASGAVEAGGRLMGAPEYSPSAIAAHPAPRREFYFTGRDYAAACMRTHDRRMKYDEDRGRKPASTSHKADTAAASALPCHG